MNHSLRCFIWLMFLLFVPGSFAWAQDDLFAGTPSPTPAFLSDHSYDNSDVDGTSLKPQKDDDIGDQSSSGDADLKEDSTRDEKDLNSDSKDQDSGGL